MRDQTAREPKFPVACARCGGRISEPVTFCPHCGAHARFALAGDAPHASQAEYAGRTSQQPRGAAGSARAQPKMPPYDFEGDLDPPWPGPPTPLFASPDGDPYGEVHAPSFRGERQWGLKGGTVLVVAAFVVLYGGAVAVHRYDSASPLSSPAASKAADGAIASAGGGGTNVAPPSDNDASSNGNVTGGNAIQPPTPAVGNTAPSGRSAAANSVAGNNTVTNGAPPAAGPTSAPMQTQNADASRAPDGSGAPATPGTSVASLPPSSTAIQTAPSAAPAATAPRAQPDSTPDSRTAGRARSHARSDEARGGFGDTAVAGNPSARQPYRSQAPREGAQYGPAAAAHALDIAQAQLAKSDLRGARASLARALAADPHNGGALSLREQLLAREQERDASLSAAHACVVESRWNCVWHNAGKALSVDASSTEAKALVDRAIVESGAATAPAGPGPDNVEVPMVQ
jgi:hypothetical protein